MTRITNFGRKRTYLQAGLESSSSGNAVTQNWQSQEGEQEYIGNKNHLSKDSSDEPAKKKLKTKEKRKKSKRQGNVTARATDGELEGAQTKSRNSIPLPDEHKEGSQVPKDGKLKKQRRILSSEKRRAKRTQQRAAETTCFACREKGHAAKDCPKSRNVPANSAKRIVGICYRCGSTRHRLSTCRNPADESNPLPYASCFVCNGKGHLASSCPENTEKGIYPNGGACKLCGEKTHLAKDCALRKKDVVDPASIIGTSDQTGADEDDFHVFKRRKLAVDKEAKEADVKKKTLQIKAGAYSGIVKSFTIKPRKKVVYF